MLIRILTLAILTFVLELEFQVRGAPKNEQQQSIQEIQTNKLDSGADSTYEEALLKQDNRRPIWSIAHMINSIKELESKLVKGAHGVEADVTFSRDGEPRYTYHGPPCDCWRHCNQKEDFEEYLKYIKKVSIDTPNGVGEHLSLLILDLKLSSLSRHAKERAGQLLAKSIMNNLFGKNYQQVAQSRPFYLIISINHVTDVDLVKNFMHTLEMNDSGYLLDKHIGFDVGMNDKLQSIESMWRTFSNNGDTNLNLWQGDGITNCLSPFFKLDRLSKALAKRDNLDGYPDKVYHWTIDLHDKMHESLLLGVDAIMTNHPERVASVLQEPMLVHDLRLATRYDDPFEKITRDSTGQSSEMAKQQRRSTDTPNGSVLNRKLVDVLESMHKYVKEFPKLSSATTLKPKFSSKPKPVVAPPMY